MNSNFHDWSRTMATTWWLVSQDAAIKSAIVLLLAWVATLLMRRASAAMRHLVWMLAVSATLALPVLSSLLPGWRILPAWMNHEPAADVAVIPQAAGGAGSREVARSQGVATDSLVSGARVVSATEAGLNADNSPAGPGSVSKALAARPPAARWSDRVSRQSWMLMAWGIGTAVLLLPIPLSLLSLWRLERGCLRIDGGSWGHLLCELVERLNLRRSITLVRGREQRMPMTWGFVRPILLLPPDADAWQLDRRRVVLMHELAHIRRGDFLTQLIVHVARAIYWFNPLMWMAWKQSAVESEGACDDLVLAHETQASNYAEHLLTVAAGLKENALFPVAAIAMARSSRLEGRLKAILNVNRNRRGLTASGIMCTLALLAGSVLPLAMLRAADRDTTEITIKALPQSRPSTNPAKPEMDSSPLVFTARDGQVVMAGPGNTEIVAARIEVAEIDRAGSRNQGRATLKAGAVAVGESAGKIADDWAPVKIELEREVRINGVVQDPDGNPVAGATVAPADGTGNSLTGDTRFSVLSANDGTFVITLPASGKARYNLEAHDGGHEQWRKWANGVLDPIQTKPGDELKDVVIKLTRPALVRGHVKDESGKPLAGREVRASAADKRENRYYDPTTKTDANGDFELRFIRPGEQYIQAAPFFWTNVPPGGMTLKLKEGETNSLLVTLKEGETRVGVELTAPASTRFPSREEQLRRAMEKMEHPATRPAAPDAAAPLRAAPSRQTAERAAN